MGSIVCERCRAPLTGHSEGFLMGLFQLGLHGAAGLLGHSQLLAHPLQLLTQRLLPLRIDGLQQPMRAVLEGITWYDPTLIIIDYRQGKSPQ